MEVGRGRGGEKKGRGAPPKLKLGPSTIFLAPALPGAGTSRTSVVVIFA